MNSPKQMPPTIRASGMERVLLREIWKRLVRGRGRPAHAQGTRSPGWRDEDERRDVFALRLLGAQALSRLGGGNVERDGFVLERRGSTGDDGHVLLAAVLDRSLRAVNDHAVGVGRHELEA